MPFKNRARLPFYLTRPQFPDEANVFTLADGTTKTQSVIIKKIYEGKTGNMPEQIHQRLKTALRHDTVKIENDRYYGEIALSGDYDIDWQEFLDYPVAQASFQAQVTPFDFSNSNCQSCQEANQVVLVDDVFADPLDQDETYTINVFTNDTIGCSPIIATIVNYSSTFLVSATIDGTGVVTIVTKPSFIMANGVKLLTYRVLCPNGGYDEADVYANMNGEEPACLAPLNVENTATGDDGANPGKITSTYGWDAPNTPPADGYDWILDKVLTDEDNPVTFVPFHAEGSTNSLSVTIGNIDGGYTYRFGVRSKCDDDNTSQYINVTMELNGESDSCGIYKVSRPAQAPPKPYDIAYIAVNGQLAFLGTVTGQVKTIRAAEQSPGIPRSIIGPTIIQYQGPCE